MESNNQDVLTDTVSIFADEHWSLTASDVTNASTGTQSDSGAGCSQHAPASKRRVLSGLGVAGTVQTKEIFRIKRYDQNMEYEMMGPYRPHKSFSPWYERVISKRSRSRLELPALLNMRKTSEVDRRPLRYRSEEFEVHTVADFEYNGALHTCVVEWAYRLSNECVSSDVSSNRHYYDMYWDASVTELEKHYLRHGTILLAHLIRHRENVMMKLDAEAYDNLSNSAIRRFIFVMHLKDRNFRNLGIFFLCMVGMFAANLGLEIQTFKKIAEFPIIQGFPKVGYGFVVMSILQLGIILLCHAKAGKLFGLVLFNTVLVPLTYMLMRNMGRMVDGFVRILDILH